jgi:iron complex outermembrane receptor protein
MIGSRLAYTLVSVSSIALSAMVAQAASAQAASAATPGLGATATAADEQAQTIVVTGSRLSSTGFSAPTPVTVVGAADIARQAAPNIAEVLNQVPAFRAQSTPSTSAIFASNLGASTADLRGLGANRTLVLIDGRRVVASTTQGGSFTPANAVDLNMVPTSLIARSEVVTGGASAAYGSDAVAGVVNLILDTKLEGVRGSVQYGRTDAGDGKDYAASLAFGTSFGGGRGHFIVGGDYDDNKGTGDCYTRAWCAQSYGTFTNPLYKTNGQPATLTVPNIRTAVATRNGLITAGPLMGTEFAPDGSTFKHDYGIFYGAGINQIGGGDPRNPFFEFFSMAAPVRRYSTLAHANYDITDSITAYAEGSYANVHAHQFGAQVRDLGSITIQRDNAYLPTSVGAAMDANALTNFRFGRIGDDFGPSRATVRRETYRFVGGLDGKLGGSWKWGLYYQYGRTNYAQDNANNRINDNFTRAVDAVRGPNGTIVCRSTLTDPGNGCLPLNLFGENNFNPAAVAYSFGTAIQRTHLTQQVVSGQVSGDVFNTWAGPVSVAFGGEYRKDGAHGTADPISSALRFYTSGGAAINGDINVKEGFAEVGVPLARDLPFAKTLDLNGAIRVTDYSTSGSVTSWKLGGTWEPVSQFRLRVTRSRDIRAPNIFELKAPTSTSFQTVMDPAKGQAFVLPLTILGGNPNLRPEIAKTLTVGGVFSPDFWGLNRFRVSVDYYDIKLNGAISTLGSQVIVNLCNQGQTALCANVVRDTGGNLVSISNVNLNLNRLSRAASTSRRNIACR